MSDPTDTTGHPRILVIKRRYLGDLVLMGPVFRNLRLQYPQAWITALVDGKYADVQAHNPDLNQILSIPDSRSGSLPGQLQSWLRLLIDLRRSRFDVVYDFTHNSRSTRLARWTRAPKLVGYTVEGHAHPREQNYPVLATWTQADHENCHIVDLCLKLLEADGIPLRTREVVLAVSPQQAVEARELMDRACGKRHGPLMIVHPGARLEARCWPAENYALVCDAVQRQFKVHVVLLAGPGEEGIVQQIQSQMTPPPVTLDAPASVPRLAALLQQADLFLGNDSGPMHVAAAVGTPVVALFGGQSTTLWHPVGAGHVVLQASQPCPCPFPSICQPPDNYKMLCIRRIGTGEVLDAVANRLKALTGSKKTGSAG